MNPNSLPSERAAVVGVIDPDAYGTGTQLSAFAPVSKFRRFMAIISVGDIVSTGVLNAKLQRASDASGTGAEDITGAAITPLTQAGGDSNKQAIINYDTQGEEGNAKNFIGISATLTVAGADMGAVLMGFDPFSAPASDNDVSTVDEIVSKP